MKIANIVSIYTDIVPDNYVLVRKPIDENAYESKLTTVARLLNGPLADAHVSGITVFSKAYNSGTHVITLTKTGKDYLSVAECIAITRNILADDTLIFVNDDTGEVLYSRAYEALTGKCVVSDYEVINVYLGSEQHAFYVKDKGESI